MSTNRDLYIYGSGGLGREILSLANHVGGWTFRGFIDDTPSKQLAYDNVFPFDHLCKQASRGVVDLLIGVADVKGKREIVHKTQKIENVNFPNLVSPLAYIDPSSKIGEGTIISHFCFISCDVKIGSFCFFNVSCSVGHDSTVGNYFSGMPGTAISGNVLVGERVFMGSKSFILQGKSVGDNVMIGVGGNVLRNISSGSRIYAPKSIKID